MKFGIKTLDDFDFYNKVVLCRIDINQPIDSNGNLKDITRIKACIATIRELSEKGAKTVLLAHQGSDIEYNNFYTTKPHGLVLSTLLNKNVKFIDDVCGPCARQEIKNLNKGEILLLDNVRFVSEEQTLFELKINLSHKQQANTLLVNKLAPLADIYVCDAFAAAHRSQPSLCGFPQLLPSAMGRLFEKEISVINELLEKPKRPCVFILGGSKISDAFIIMQAVLQKKTADLILTGGVVANIFHAALGVNIGKGSVDYIIKNNYGNYIEKAVDIYNKFRDKIVLPQDYCYLENNSRLCKDAHMLPNDIQIIDIGEKTAAKYSKIIKQSSAVFANGPMGIFEQQISEYGTKKVWQALADTKAYTVIGGGDSVAAAEKFNVSNDISYISTGGGALIRYLSGEELPVIKALKDAAKRGNKNENI